MHRLFPLLLLVVGHASAFAQAPLHPLAEKAAPVVEAEIDRQKIVGAAVVLFDERGIVWQKGYGFADRENAVPVDPEATQFRWASVSKPITAIAALQLAEQGKLDLDADVRTYVPEFPDKGAKITSRMLLCHQAGIVHYGNGEVVVTKKEYADPHPFADVVVALDKFKDSPLIHPPGDTFDYSTHGYILLSAVVQRAGGARFADQVRERIAAPLGMTGLRPDYLWEDIPGRAAGYRRDSEGNINRRPDDQVQDVSWKLGGGGFTSPATDMARLGVGLLQHRLVSAETERQMWTVHPPRLPQKDTRYGYGFFVAASPGGLQLVGHDGSQQKARTCLMLDVAGRRGVAMTTNSEWVDAADFGMKLLEAIQ